MSHKTFSDEWRQAMTNLLEQLNMETPAGGTGLPKEIPEVKQYLANLYVHYIRIFNKLEECYDQMAHPQKRIEIKHVLEATMGRMLEIKDLLVKIEGTDWVCLDRILHDKKIAPEELELAVPRYFLESRSKELKERERLLNALITQYSVKPVEVQSEPTAPPMSITEAVRIIQVNVRGRQGRLLAKKQRELKQQAKKAERFGYLEPELDAKRAATVIQKVWRGHYARSKVADMRRNEAVFIKMQPPPNRENDPMEKVAQTRQRRKLIQNQNEQEYKLALVNLREQLVAQEGPDMKEKIQDEIRQWFISHREKTGKFPVFPPPEAGGSLRVLRPDDPTLPKPKKKPVAEGEGKDDGKGRGRGKDGPKPKQQQAGRGRGRGTVDSKKAAALKFSRRKKEEKPEHLIIDLAADYPSQFVSTLQQCATTYVSVWKDRDESNNFAQKHDAELVKAELRPDVEREIRRQVDELLRVELQNLKLSVERDRRRKKAKQAGKKRGPTASRVATKPRRKAPKSQGAKKKKKRRAKQRDLTAGRSMESLFAELVQKKLIVKCPEVRIADFAGSYNYMVGALRDAGIAPDPSFADIRRAVIEYCILPLGSEYVHKLAPQIKAVLLYGPKGVGKTMLAHAIAHETGSVLFDLSPANIKGKYLGKVKLMLHMVFKVAKVMAPSVIYIDEVDKVFRREKKSKVRGPPISRTDNKPPAEEEKLATVDPPKEPQDTATPATAATAATPNDNAAATPATDNAGDSRTSTATEANKSDNPRRIKKELLLQLKQLKPSDRVLVVGTTRTPYAPGTKAMLSFFNKFLYIPYPDYTSRQQIWKHLILAKGGRITEALDLSILTKISEGYTAGTIAEVVDKAMQDNRAQAIERKPLALDEFIDLLAKYNPVYQQEYEAFASFNSKVPKKKPKTIVVEDEPPKKKRRKKPPTADVNAAAKPLTPSRQQPPSRTVTPAAARPTPSAAAARTVSKK